MHFKVYRSFYARREYSKAKTIYNYKYFISWAMSTIGSPLLQRSIYIYIYMNYNINSFQFQSTQGFTLMFVVLSIKKAINQIVYNRWCNKTSKSNNMIQLTFVGWSIRYTHSCCYNLQPCNINNEFVLVILVI